MPSHVLQRHSCRCTAYCHRTSQASVAITSFSGYHKLQWLTQSTHLSSGLCTFIIAWPWRKIWPTKLRKLFVCHAGSLRRGSPASAGGVLLLLSVWRPACPCCPSISQLCPSGLSGSRQSLAFGEDATGRAERQLQGAAAAATQWCGSRFAGSLC